ncbi:MAG: hypothetical protein CMO80_23720 [Verrucomicrobiales bacterium]|nr:hypothetical protein [Verrucomicrobiales bacterium]|tara:strand:+ start:1960 stop:2685 length:726 start_codon:yes stop_codon:yes gene_type:complete
MPTTAHSPKCYAEVQGKRMLDWGLEAFADAGVTDICFIGGYLIDKVRTDYPHFKFRHNQDWPNNNILESLMHAQDLMDEPFICCYSDILFSANLVKGLLDHPGSIALAVDTGWERRYEFRTEHPPDDAEKVIVNNGTVTKVHRGIPPENAYGEYTGVARFDKTGAQKLKEYYLRAKEEYSGRPFREAKVFEKAYKILLFQEMIEAGVTMYHVDTDGEYMEIDTQQDFELGRQQWRGRIVID